MTPLFRRGEPAWFSLRLLASPGGITIEGHLTTTCIPHSGGTVYLLVGVTTGPGRPPDLVRRPLNLAVVLDRSGSMADEHKFEYARDAICSLLDHLSGEDYLSIVVYDDRIETLLPTQRVRNRNETK